MSLRSLSQEFSNHPLYQILPLDVLEERTKEVGPCLLKFAPNGVVLERGGVAGTLVTARARGPRDPPLYRGL